MGLSAHPADRIPEGVHSQTYDLPLFGSREDGEIPDGMRTFVYTANNPDSPVIKHIYTCNRPSMQVEPNYLFRDLQLFVHLQWQKAATKLAIGPYFTYLAGFGHEGESTPDPWNKVPVCITRAREFMQNLGRRSGQYEAFTVDQLTVLAWHNTGSRKGSPFPARDTPVAILCLGADVEFSLSPRAGFPPVEVSMQLGQSPRRNLKASKVKYEVKDLADSDDDDDDEEPLFTRLGHTRSVSNSALVKASAKRKRQSELLLTLVHGDMLMLSGDEFEWVLKRTGMSIILIGPDLAGSQVQTRRLKKNLFLDVEGVAWLFGRNEKSALGVPGELVSENAPIRLTAQELGAPNGTKFVYAACGRNHTLLVGDDGQLWTCGANNMGQCGHPVCPEVTKFKLVSGPKSDGNKDKVIKAAAGLNFSLILTDTGRVYAFGSAERGQLGNGKTGEHIVTGGKLVYDAEPEPLLIKALDGHTIVDVACGQQHAVALTSDGHIYVWGCNGYGRMGLGTGLQNDVLIPKVVPHFAGPNEKTRAGQIITGPTNTVVIDRQQMYFMAGKWKNTGEGSSGQPYSSFRYIQDVMGCKISHASCGGVTHWLLAVDDDGSTMTIAFGQNASNVVEFYTGELGLGPEEPKSATKPTKHDPLNEIDVIQIAAGQNTTFFLAKPSDKLSDLPRHPVDVEPPEVCVVCNEDNGDDDSPLACDKCDYPYHIGCLDPPLDAVPDGEWFCPECEDEPGAPVAIGGVRKPVKRGVKSKAMFVDDEEDEHTGQKRKAPAKKAAPSKKRK
ncbi:hypothetical protein EW026_g2605 [Hermanssonia centrifuga]|uniref:PHD-type domain-containing protein n=1 Tax=Hermanssonia centrifuga TaxID=98765 RepID=A0A4S4KSD4_9APHY|nr:hypothetical protein EW026_g2605 [Hermanssonia centrifuga]